MGWARGSASTSTGPGILLRALVRKILAMNINTSPGKGFSESNSNAGPTIPARNQSHPTTWRMRPVAAMTTFNHQGSVMAMRSRQAAKVRRTAA